MGIASVPALGPTIGGFLSEVSLDYRRYRLWNAAKTVTAKTEGWKWVQGFLGIFTGVLTFIAWLTGACADNIAAYKLLETNVSFLQVPETYVPTLLRRRAARLLRATGRYYSAQVDGNEKMDFAWLGTQLTRPWLLLFQEPIVFVISVYMAIVYVGPKVSFAAEYRIDLAVCSRGPYTCCSRPFRLYA